MTQAHAFRSRKPEDVKFQQGRLRELRERLDYRYDEVVDQSAIDPEVALERDYHLEKSKTGLAALGFTRAQQRVPAMVVPRFSPSGEELAPQIKPDSPRPIERDGKLKAIKYETARGASIRLSVHPRAVKVLRDIRYPIWVVEGDKKGDALVSQGAAAVALQGVTCWDVPQDWEEIKLYGREVIVSFDADVMVNPAVGRELSKLSAFLRSRGAKVRYLRWPEQYKNTTTGVDDFLANGDGTLQDLYRMAEETLDEEAMPVGTSMADIEPERVTWFWNRRIPKGKVTILDGNPGMGKSLILYDLAARATVGAQLPDGQPLERGAALIVSAEDGAADTIVPRFIAAGGDTSRARILGSNEPFIIPDDLDKLERAIKQTGATFVAIDPIMSFLSDSVNSNRDQDVRRALQPLVDIAARTDAAIVICRHLNKSSGGETIYRGQGSIGFIGIVRSGLVVGRHPETDGVFILAGQKHNLSKPPESLAYTITELSPDDETARVKYLGVSEISAQQMNATPEDEGERDRLSEAKAFLRDMLRSGPEFTTRIKAEAREAEMGWRTVERAKAQLKVQVMKDPATGKWQWVLSKPQEVADEDRRVDRLGGDGGLGGDGKTANDGGFGGDGITTTTTTENMAYLREDRQDRQDRQPPIDNLQHNTATEERQDRQHNGEVTSWKCRHDVPDGCWICRKNGGQRW
jgi:hypothetical protein